MQKSRKNLCLIIIISLLCLITVLSELICLPITSDKTYNRLICNLLPPFFGGIAVILLCKLTDSKIFGKPQNLMYLIPCVIIAIDNFPFAAYFAGKMQLIYTRPIHFLLFGAYCLCVGVFEEIIFRYFLFSALASRFERNKRGLLKTFIITSLIFGEAHLLNILSGDGIATTFLQAGYCVLTGGLFAFVFIKTKNILCAAGIHAIYNFCGLLFTSNVGLGTGSVLDLPTIITMTVVCVVCGGFILFKLAKISDEEVLSLYRIIQIPIPPKSSSNSSKSGENTEIPPKNQ